MTAACGTTAPVLSDIVPLSSPVTRELCAINEVEGKSMIASCIKAARKLWPLNTEPSSCKCLGTGGGGTRRRANATESGNSKEENQMRREVKGGGLRSGSR